MWDARRVEEKNHEQLILLIFFRVFKGFFFRLIRFFCCDTTSWIGVDRVAAFTEEFLMRKLLFNEFWLKKMNEELEIDFKIDWNQSSSLRLYFSDSLDPFPFNQAPPNLFKKTSQKSSSWKQIKCKLLYISTLFHRHGKTKETKKKSKKNAFNFLSFTIFSSFFFHQGRNKWENGN